MGYCSVPNVNSLAVSEIEDTPAIPETTNEMNIVLQIVPFQELKKKNKRNIQALSREFRFSLEEEFDVLKAQILVRIDSALHPARIVFEDYDITYTIKRVANTKSVLSSAEDYECLRSRARTVKKPEVTIFIEQQRIVKIQVNGFCSELIGSRK